MPSLASSPLFRIASLSAVALAAGCNAPPPPPQYAPQAAVVAPAAAPAYGYAPQPVRVGRAPAPQESYLPAVALAPIPPVVSVYVEPPLAEPPPLLIPIAPPPMLVEVPPPEPFPLAVWTGGYWAWHGGWIWSAGRWLAPPRPHYVWVQPYYEHRNDAVVFVGAHWAPPGVVFVPPPSGLKLTISAVIGGFGRGPAPEGPQGVFVPPPPGSHWGLIVPAPIGTAPAVVSSAPPIIHIGMRVENRNSNNRDTNINSNNVTNRQVTNNITNVTNVTNVTNIRNVTVVAPAGSTANGQAFQALVPAAAHLAAARPALVRAEAPRPLSERAVPAFRAGEKFAALPAAQPVKVGALVNPSLQPPATRPSAAEPRPNVGAPVERARSAAESAVQAPGPQNAARQAQQAKQARRDAIERKVHATPQRAAKEARQAEKNHPAPVTAPVRMEPEGRRGNPDAHGASAAPDAFHAVTAPARRDEALLQRPHQEMEQQARERQDAERQKAAQMREETAARQAQAHQAPTPAPDAARAAALQEREHRQEQEQRHAPEQAAEKAAIPREFASRHPEERPPPHALPEKREAHPPAEHPAEAHKAGSEHPAHEREHGDEPRHE